MRSGTPMKRSRNDVALRTERPSYRTHRSSTRQGFTYPRVTLSERVRRHRNSGALHAVAGASLGMRKR